MKYNLKKVHSGIYLITAHTYDLGMLFFRCQKYYESSLKKIYRKNISFFDAMREYSLKISKDKSFTYPEDWSGFNIPGEIIKECLHNRPETTPYDEIMLKIVERIEAKTDKFYLIGARPNGGAIKHEIAHGLYYTNPQYKAEMDENITHVPLHIIDYVHRKLKKVGYNPIVFDDELQAYFSTGLTKTLKKVDSEYCDPFKTTFKKFTKKKS